MDHQQFIDFEVTLDPGSADHVVESADTPGHEVQESAGRMAGACFVGANGESIPNRCQVNLQLQSGAAPITSTFQVSRIWKPLWSVGEVCDAGHGVAFAKDSTNIFHTASGEAVGNLHRKHGL